MITNERQYKITKAQLKKLEQASEELGSKDSQDALDDLSLEALKSEVDVLRFQIHEYEELKAGLSVPVSVHRLSDLPSALIRARIAKGMTQRDLAESIGLKEQQIQRNEATGYSSVSLRRLLEVAAVVGLDVVATTDDATDSDRPPTAVSDQLDWERFPVKEMYRRHWFEGFQGSQQAALQASEALVSDYIRSVIKQPALAMHRKHVRSGSILDEYALIAWEARVWHIVESASLKTRYHPGSISTTWLREFVRLSRHSDGPLRAQQALAELGIALVVEPHLPETHLDGACFLRGEKAAIGLTLRYDRLDNFWFVLLHEVAHLHKHLRKGELTATFDDLEAESVDRLEEEADSFASEALLPSSVWEAALARYVRSKESILSFAGELQINPAIIAGRIRHEADNYVILSDLVGSRAVRRLFGNVEFGV